MLLAICIPSRSPPHLYSLPCFSIQLYVWGCFFLTFHICLFLFPNISQLFPLLSSPSLPRFPLRNSKDLFSRAFEYASILSCGKYPLSILLGLWGQIKEWHIIPSVLQGRFNLKSKTEAEGGTGERWNWYTQDKQRPGRAVHRIVPQPNSPYSPTKPPPPLAFLILSSPMTVSLSSSSIWLYSSCAQLYCHFCICYFLSRTMS